MRDRITLADMRFFGYHGALPSERERGQEFSVDVELETDLRDAGRTDNLELTVDYRRVYDAVTTVMMGEPKHLLEAVADEMARRLLELDRVQAVTVRIRKPSVPLPGPLSHAAVEIRRERR